MTTTSWTAETRGVGQYAEVNGLNMYFETRGGGRPMILLHGGWGRARCSGRFCRCSLSATRSSPRTCRVTAALPTSIDQSTSG